MKKIISAFLMWFILIALSGQAQKTVSTYLSAQYDKTIYDRTLGNNPWGAGLGFQAFFSNKTKFKPTIELTGDLYLEDDKVFRTNTNGTPIHDVKEMVNLLAGTSYAPAKNIYLSLVAGPSFVSGRTLLGVKPSFGLYFGKHYRFTGKLSYINIFNRDKVTKKILVQLV